MFSPQSEYQTLPADLRFRCARPALLIRGGFKKELMTLVIAALASTAEAQSASTGTTLYINQYYEVRDHDAPTKYVFSGQTRVAHVTGSLSTNLRLQRLRVYAGWNLVSLAVTAVDALAQLSTAGPQPTLEALYKWVPQSSNFVAVASGESLPAGTVLWLKSTTNASLSLLGGYSEPVDVPVSNGGSFVPAAGLEAWCLTNPLPPGVSLWQRDPGEWAIRLGSPLPSLSELRTIVAPGEAIFVEANAPARLEVPSASLRIHYYHQDHLGSSAVTTDVAGSLIEETAYYPYGEPRNESHPRSVREDYQFTQKEQDRESGLDYFEARYLNAPLARFISPDPEADSVGRRNPQTRNCYAYAMGNPLRYIDPHGLFTWDANLGGNKADADVSEEIRTQREAFRGALKAARDATGNIKNASDKAQVLRALNAYGAEGVANDVTVGFVSSQGGSGYTDYNREKSGNKLTSKSMHVTFKDDLLSKQNKLAHTIAHEGTHVADYEAASAAASKDYASAQKSDLNMTYREMDTRAYTVESIVGQALGVTVSKGEGQIIYDTSWAKKQMSREEIGEKRAAAIQKIFESKTGENLERKILR